MANTYNGDISGYLGRDLISDDYRKIGSQFGNPDLGNGTEFLNNGNWYGVADTAGNGTRRINMLESDSARQARQLTEQNTRQQQELADKQRAETDARFASNKQELGDYNNEYASKVPQVFNQVFDKYNIPTLTNAVNSLRGRIDDLQGNTSGGASGYANASQVDKAINTNYLPRFTNAAQALSTSMDVGQREFNNMIDPMKVKGQLLNDRIARETTAYSDVQQRELQGLLAVMQTNGSLTQAQWARADALAQQHLEYLSTMKQLEQQQSNSDRDFAEKQREFNALHGGSGAGAGSLVDSGTWKETNSGSGSTNPNMETYLEDDGSAPDVSQPLTNNVPSWWDNLMGTLGATPKQDGQQTSLGNNLNTINGISYPNLPGLNYPNTSSSLKIGG